MIKYHFITAHSSSGLGHRPLKAEITGSNPVCATTAYGRYHHLRNVARQPIGASGPLDSRSVARRGEGQEERHLGPTLNYHSSVGIL